MEYSDHSKWTSHATQWFDQQFETISEKPVCAQIEVGEIAALLLKSAPEEAVEMETIISGFERIVPNGITHQQHPRFFTFSCKRLPRLIALLTRHAGLPVLVKKL
eukprot:GHVN01012798.1.p1 GENE.GHVN01012798.1~~GHVN01012798.1.p1  ORF type:complete len:105 (-),score=13.34 GHVN01012798.1:54-368(-)